MAKIYPANSKNIEMTAAIIRSGGIAAFPTETVYGLGGSAFNPTAIAKIFEVKNRPFFDPLIVHIADIEALKELTQDTGNLLMDLSENFWPGPLTIVVRHSNAVPDIVTSGLPTVAIRMPSHPVALELIRHARTPIAAPSANPFGGLSPTRAEHVLEGLGGSIEVILDGGPCEIGLESTIIKIEDQKAILLRPGGLPVEEIQKVTGKVDTADGSNAEAPGMLPYHYAPSKPVKIFTSSKDMDFKDKDAVFLFFKEPDGGFPDFLDKERFAVMSSTGDMKEAAATIFQSLHRLDAYPAKKIYAEAVPKKGLGLAIMDRLVKASGRI